MPLEYITPTRLCAAIFPVDNNWHRCRIVEIAPTNENLVLVNFIDYGGDSYVKKFIYLFFLF
jgi:hypothetical protein